MRFFILIAALFALMALATARRGGPQRGEPVGAVGGQKGVQQWPGRTVAGVPPNGTLVASNSTTTNTTGTGAIEETTTEASTTNAPKS